MNYKTKAIECIGVYYDGNNGEDVVKMFSHFQLVSGRLYDGSVQVNTGTYIIETSNGIKKFTQSVFEALFEEVPEKTYSISELDIDTGTKIKNKNWFSNDYIEWTGFAWKYVGEEIEILYTLTPGDLASKDWVIIV